MTTQTQASPTNEINGGYMPRLYVLNAASLSKSHALESLETDMIGYKLYNAQVICLQETNLKPQKHSENSVTISGYKCVRRDRVGRIKGGVAMYIKDNISFRSLSLLCDDPKYETQWVEIELNGLLYVYINVYHPPKPVYNIQTFIEFLQTNIDNIMTLDSKSIIIMCGDFNQLRNVDICSHVGLKVIETLPTLGNYCLDRIFVSDGKEFCIKVVTSTVKSDHKALVATNESNVISINKARSVVEYRRRSPEQHASMLSFMQANSNYFEEIYNLDNTQSMWDAFYYLLQSVFDKFYPIRKVTVTESDPTFVTPEIKSLLRTRNKRMRAGQVDKADAISSKINSLISRQNSRSLSNLDANSPIDIKEVWNAVRKLTGRNKASISVGNINAEQLNAHYAAISHDATYSQPSKIPTVPLSSQAVTEYEVFNALDKLKSTAAGIDRLPFWFLRMAAPVISAPLTFLINVSLAKSEVPNQWKCALISPVPKIKNPITPSDFRPISVLPIISRITERFVVKKFVNPALRSLPSDMSMDKQFAYRQNSSTTCLLIAMVSKIVDLLKIHSHVFLISFDYSKAFDTLAHGPLQKSSQTFLIFLNLLSTG